MDTQEKQIATKVKVLREEPCEMTFAVELPSEEVVKETAHVFKNIQARASLPGFRAGRAPMELIQHRFSSRARQNILENLVSQAAAQVLRERKLQALNTPRVDKIEFDFGKPLVFQMKVEKDPPLKARDYKGIKVTRHEAKVSDDRISKALDDLRERNASLVAASADAVLKNHFVLIDFEGKIDSVPFPGGSATNYLLDMSAPQTIAGFSESILGARMGEERMVNAQFPADHPEIKWAGQQAVFKVTVKEIKEKKRPSIDDEFAKDLGCASLAELQGKIRQSLEKEDREKADQDMEEQILQALLENNRFAVPVTLVEQRAKNLIRRAQSSLTRRGLAETNDPQSQAALYERTRPQAEKDVRLSYLFKAIAEQEHLENVDKELEELMKKALEDSKDKPEAVNNYFREHDVSLRNTLLDNKVIEFLKKNAKIKIVDD